MKARIEALTLLESDNNEAPNIGTVLIGWNTREISEQKIAHAIKSHFDCDPVKLPKIDWELLESYQDTEIEVDLTDDENPYSATILIQRTVIY